ncbi:Chromatin-remodeling complexes subunit ngg1 [Grifola frondosa]|uniref:Chromatin-remodeling complexes subunit ngg1 n=1 Tax=Grifola frondosa TaxID=5627 RepID=A0A1C7MFC5_GRIFR|nr:Chromatin-remodeling complexes subunit ngg1 [Grifola frondosa]
MSSIVSHYLSPPAIRSALFKSPPETVPPTEELEFLHAELKTLRQRTLEKAKKAGDDIITIEESMRRIREKEKGKAKAVEKVKKERAFTPLPNIDEARLSAQPQPIVQRSRLPSMPATAPASVVASATATPPLDSRKSMPEELKKKKKKRKRDDFSDTEAEPAKVRKASPLPAHTHSHPPAPKASKFPSTSNVFNKGASGPDFALPPITSLLPPRPPVPSPPIPGPSKPTEVMDDFSKSKQPSQVLVSTFYTSIEPWIRPIKEEDVGFLEYTGDEVEPLVMPKLGRHYSHVWDEEDTALYGGPLPGTAAMRASSSHHPDPSAPLPKWEPSTLMETDLLTEERGHGPLTERLVSALIPMHDATEWKGVKAAEEAMEGRPGTNGAAAAAARDKLNVADLEDRIKNVMRFHGLLNEIPDFSEAVDDPIATALRHAQRELRTVLATNNARKARLTSIARDRLGYQEYVENRDVLDKNITTMYTKLQKKDGPKVSKKKKQKGTEVAGVTNGAATGIGGLPPCPAALGLSPDEENRLHVPEQLQQLAQYRRQWVDMIGGVFAEKEEENPGRILGFPKESIYKGIEDEVRQQLERTSAMAPVPGSSSASADSRTSKGKARARADVPMELG